MVKEKIVVKNKSGLHLRPASELSQIASKMTSEIVITAGEKSINPKSVLLLMSAGITQGTEIEISCDGPDEEQDLKGLLDAIAGGFGEEMA